MDCQVTLYQKSEKVTIFLLSVIRIHLEKKNQIETKNMQVSKLVLEYTIIFACSKVVRTIVGHPTDRRAQWRCRTK